MAAEQKTMIVIVDRYCKGCGICIHFCPKHILELSDELSSSGYYTPRVTESDECTRCGQCELYCPDFAIYLLDGEESGNG